MDKWFKVGTALIGSLVGFLYGEWSVMLEVLLGLSVLDYISGFIASGVEGKLSSKIGYKGILKKIMIFLVVAAAHLADRLIDQGDVIMTAAVFFYGANELLSITENAGRAGFPIPEALKKAINVLKGNSGENQKEE